MRNNTVPLQKKKKTYYLRNDMNYFLSLAEVNLGLYFFRERHVITSTYKLCVLSSYQLNRFHCIFLTIIMWSIPFSALFSFQVFLTLIHSNAMYWHPHAVSVSMPHKFDSYCELCHQRITLPKTQSMNGGKRNNK